MNHFSEYYPDISDAEGSSMNNVNDISPCKSVGSSPQDSPSKITGSSKGPDGRKHCSHNDSYLIQESFGDSKRPDAVDLEGNIDLSYDFSIIHDQSQNTTLPSDFENNGLIWFPPPPEDEDDDVEDNFFDYDDEDDEVGCSGVFSSSCFESETPFDRDKLNDGQKEPLKDIVERHFRALVLQLLKGEGICTGTEDGDTGWLDIVSSLAWQAANFVRPDTSTGGSMDPGNYVKVKCVLFGNPCERYY